MPETTPETPAAAETEAESARPEAAPNSPRIGLQALLTKPSDLAARPGFRNPANSRSKAQKGKKRK